MNLNARSDALVRLALAAGLVLLLAPLAAAQVEAGIAPDPPPPEPVDNPWEPPPMGTVRRAAPFGLSGPVRLRP